MANNKIFVSPGLYTKEVDLSQATASIGVTALGLVGETLKGPAFEPMLVENQKVFRERFGLQSPEKFSNGVPKYELPYIANAYLGESNTLWVTRVLGLSGYVAPKAFVLKTKKVGEVNGTIIAVLRPVNLTDTTTVVSVDATKSTIGDLTIKIGTDSFAVSLDPSDLNFITKVFGTDPLKTNSKVFVEKLYTKKLLANPTAGTLSVEVVASTDLGGYNVPFQTPETPFIVSTVKAGNKVDQLFKFVSISDGEAANTEIKISIENVNFVTNEFDVVIRDFNDTDASTIVLEAFRRCSMNPQLSSYIGKRIGTLDSLYGLKSKYVIADINEAASVDSLPAGFEGYAVKGITDALIPDMDFKTVYGDSDKIRKTYLGLNSGNIETSFLKFAGEGVVSYTKGFHMDSRVDAASFVKGAEVFDKTSSGKFADISARKFTLCLAGGFDGWNIYSGDRDHTLATGKDYPAYLKGIRTFANPDDVFINLFATPGLDYDRNTALINEAIDMIEEDRADALYIISSPDDTSNDSTAEVFAKGAVDALDGAQLDTSYAATYGSWVLHNDTQNGVNIYLPPTWEVLRDMAQVDKTKAPWFAVAGWSNGKCVSTQARYKLNTPASDILYAGRINPIRTFAGSPLLIMGNKTLLKDEDSALRQINVRRLQLQIQKLVAVVAVRLVFEPNDDELQAQFKRLIEPILEDVKKQRGLIAFEVICDSVNNSASDRDQLQLNGYIRVKPTTAVEYINIAYGVTDQGAVFG